MPHPRASWIVKIATKSQKKVAGKAIKTVKSPPYGTMTTVKSPAFARPPPSGLTLIGALPVLVALKILRDILSFTRSFTIITSPLVSKTQTEK